MDADQNMQLCLSHFLNESAYELWCIWSHSGSVVHLHASLVHISAVRVDARREHQSGCLQRHLPT
jgi:hypothetical protein